MSKYSLVYCTDRELPEWLVIEGEHRVVFKSASEEEAECMLTEFRICEQGEEYNVYANQLTEFDYV